MTHPPGWLPPLTVLVLLGAGGQALAYPTSNRLGYVSCSACHVSPGGGGKLSTYGRGISDAQSALMRSAAKWEEETEGGPPSLQSRMLAVLSKDGSARLIPMQLDLETSSRIPGGLRADLTAGLAPVRGGGGGIFDRIFARKALLAKRLGSTEISLGRDALPYGISLDDHTLFLRSESRRGVFDTPTQLKWDSWNEGSSLSSYLFAPSFEELPGNREYGAGARFEGDLSGQGRILLGASGLFGVSPALSRLSVSLHSRLAWSERSGVLAEGQLQRRSQAGAEGFPFWQENVFLRPYYLPLEWLELSFNIDGFVRGEPFSERALQYGPNAWVRVSRELSLIADARFVSRADAVQSLFSVQAWVKL